MGVGVEWARGAAAALVAVMLVAACAPTPTAAPSGGTGPTTSSPDSRGPPSSREPETATASGERDGQVAVFVERDHYAPNEPIDLQIRNGLSDPITTVDQQAFCGILRLDRAIGTDWEEVRNCASGPPPRDVVIGPGELLRVTWEPGLGKGVYRARLVYTIGAAFVAGEASEVVSAQLTVD